MPKTGRTSIGLVQMVCSQDPARNLERAIELIADAASQGANVICLPELFLTHYFCQSEDPAVYRHAEPVPGPTTLRLEQESARLGVSIIASLFEKRADGLYHNTTAVLDPVKGYLGKYRKMHIPDDPLYYEKYYFAPGDLGYRTFDTGGLRIGVLICWDQWYPEAARLTAMRGAQILFYPTAIGWHPGEKEEHGNAQYSSWETIQRSHAIANGCFVASVNRTGFEPTTEGGSFPDGVQFWGQSFLAGPDGVIKSQAPEKGECVLVQEIDTENIALQRHGWPFLRDRRIESYGDLTRRFIDDE